ncbi:GTP-binding protein [Candidatus Bathyarchaeota archaeon]|nr:MAG: GTP-binding protein [Candidatus Bathyarchaeota archaeon]
MVKNLVLSEMLEDGFREGLSTIIWCTPLVDGTVLAYQLCYSKLEEGYGVIYFVNNKRPDIIVEDCIKYGWNIYPFIENQRLIFVDGFTPLMGIKNEGEYFVRNPFSLEEISSLILSLIKKSENLNGFLVIDSLSTLIDNFGFQTLNSVALWNKVASVCDVPILYLFTEWDYDNNLKEKLVNLCDNILEIKVIERNIIASEVFTVKKLKGELVKQPMVPFKYVKPGGLKVYIPKILVTGPYNAGKTTVVHALSTRAVSVDRESTTIALDFGHLEYKGFTADLFGTIGQQRFDPVLEQLGGESLGVILVIDSVNPQFERAVEMLRKAKVYGLPLVVFANKQDLPKALSVEAIRKGLRLPFDVPIIGTVATKKEGIFEGLDLLLQQIF